MNEYWNTADYRHITRARFDEGLLNVAFANGDEVRIEPERVLTRPPRTPDWASIRVEADAVVIPIADGRAEIPWDTIRVVTDSAFAAHRAQAAEIDARRLGALLRALRTRRGLTAREVARRTGISPVNLSRIEAGKHNIVFTTLSRILRAMGCDYADLALLSVDLEPDVQSDAPDVSLDEPVVWHTESPVRAKP